MPRFKITINARVIDYASRSFLVDVDDGTQLRTLSSDVLNELADESHVPWVFGNIGCVEVDEHEVTDCTEGDEANLSIANLGDCR